MVWAMGEVGNLLENVNALFKPKHKSIERTGFGGTIKPGKDKCDCFKVPIYRYIHGQHLYTITI